MLVVDQRHLQVRLRAQREPRCWYVCDWRFGEYDRWACASCLCAVNVSPWFTRSRAATFGSVWARSVERVTAIGTNSQRQVAHSYLPRALSARKFAARMAVCRCSLRIEGAHWTISRAFTRPKERPRKWRRCGVDGVGRVFNIVEARPYPLTNAF